LPGSHRSQRQIEKLTGINRSSIQRVIAKDLKLKSLMRLRELQRTEGSRLRRLQRARILLRRYPRKQDSKKMCFQDETDLTLEVPANRQNNRCYTKGLKRDISLERLVCTGSRFSKKLMVSCCISHEGLTPPFFVDPQ